MERINQDILYGQFLNHKKNKIKLQNLIKDKNLALDYLNVNTVCKYIYKLSFNNKNNNEVNICSGKKLFTKYAFKMAK